MLSTPELKLSQCDQEPIRAICAIQPHGFFLAFRLSDRVIYHASENISDLIKKPLKEILNSSLDQFFKSSFIEKVFEAASVVKKTESEVVSGKAFADHDELFEVLIYNLDGLIALEFEPKPIGPFKSSISQSHKTNQNFVEDFHHSQSLTEASQLICRAVRQLIDFDRVMLYRYLPSWDGEVIAEDKISEMHSFLHHRFPASDIPLPARQLYLENRTRQIFDSALGSVGIEPELHYITRKKIDLSQSKLRAVSAVHLTYLQNMGVKSSFSIAVIMSGKLWGLIACHSSKAQIISHEIRMACETLASTFSIFANMMENLQTNSARVQFDEKLQRLFQLLRVSRDPARLLLSKHALVEELFSASGIAISDKEKTEIAGLSLPVQETQALAALLRKRFKAENKTMIATDSLMADFDEEWKKFSNLACGVLAIFSPDDNETVFLIFRAEVVKTTSWGGDPRKTLEKRNYGGPINPRLSFETWSETVSGFSTKWAAYETLGAEFLRDFVFDNLIRKENLIQQLGSHIEEFRKSK